jgi:hypothetical protein
MEDELIKLELHRSTWHTMFAYFDMATLPAGGILPAVLELQQKFLKEISKDEEKDPSQLKLFNQQELDDESKKNES